VVAKRALRDHHHMNLNRLRRSLAGLIAEDRPGFKHVDGSPAPASLHRRWNA
jgi:hypothetical protein